MSDLIKRQDAIDCFWDAERHFRDALDVIKDIRHLPSAQQWIPCSERLPEENGQYLVTVQRIIEEEHREELGGNEKSAKKMRFYNGEWKIGKHIPDWINEVIHDTVIAWMPLPEPYKEVEE